MELHLIKNPPQTFFQYANAFKAPIESSVGNEYYLVAMDEHNLDKSQPIYSNEELDKFGILKFDNNFTIKTSGDIYQITSGNVKKSVIHNILYGDASSIASRIKNITNKTGIVIENSVFCIVNDYEIIIFTNKTISEIKRLIRKNYLLLKYNNNKFVEVS